MKNDNTNNKEKIINFPKKSSGKGKNLYRFLGYIALIIFMIVILLLVSGDSSFNTTNSVNDEIITLANTNNYVFSAYKEGYILAADGKISCYNTNQELQWEISGSKTAPKVKVNEEQILVYYPEDKLAIVTNGSKTKRIKTTGNVQYGHINSNGYIVLLLDESGLKNKITVYNHKGEMLYYRDNPDKFISYALLSDDNYSLITTELITNKDNVSSEFVVTNIRKNETVSNVKFENSIPGGCILTKKKEIIALLENKIQCYNISSGKLKWQKDFGGKSLFKYDYDDGLFAFVFNVDDSANTGSEILYFTKSGKKIGECKTESKIHDIDLCGKTALITMDREIRVINTKGKNHSSANITYDIKDVIFMANKKCALILSNSQEAKLLPLE